MTLSAGTADGAVIATDDIASVHYQYVKTGIGADDTFTILVGGTGVDAAGVLRVSLATNVALPAGTNAIGKLAANSGVDIGDVDVTTVGTITPGTAASSLGKAEDAAHSSGDVGVMLLAVREATATDLSAGNTDGDYEPLQVDASGRLWTHAALVDTVTAVTTVSTVTAVTTVSTVSAFGTGTTGPMKKEDVASADGDAGIAVFAIRDDTLDIRSGTEGDWEPFHTNANGALWTADVNSASMLTSLQLIDDPVIADDAAFTPATTKVMMVGFEADESSTDSVDEGDGGAARMTLDRKIITTLQPHTSGGLTTVMASGSDGSSILVATSQVLKASAGQLYGYHLYNPEAAVTYVHFYNTASASVTVGTTNPLFTIPVLAGGAVIMPPVGNGITFSNAGWAWAATTTAGGNTAPATGVSAVAWIA